MKALAEMKCDTEQNDEIGVAVQSWLWVRVFDKHKMSNVKYAN